MLYHNLKLAFRNLFRHKTFSSINVLGLSIGLAGCIIIGLYAFTELSFDRFHKNHRSIYRINQILNENKEGAETMAITPGALAVELPKEVPEVFAATRFRPWFNEMLVSYDTVHIKLDEVAYTDNQFLQIFDFPLIEGNQKTALSEPFTAVVTEATAKKYFKDGNAIGKTVTTLNNIPVKITGVAKDIPFNSSLRFNMLISWATVAAPANANYFSWMNSLSTNVGYTFVQLKPGTDILKAGEKISAFQHKHRDEKEFSFRLFLQSLGDIHLHSSDLKYAGDFHTNSVQIVYTLLIIAGLILLIGCFNFINLTTASALGRSKETGVQKALGASRYQLIKKFFGESVVMCCFSLAVALLLVNLALPFFNGLANTQLEPGLLFKSDILFSLGILLLTISLIAGLYPAIFLSRFKSTDVFRNVLKSSKNNWLRQSMITMQFALSILLIIATIVVNHQIHYLASKDLGFDKDQVAVIQLANTNIERNNQTRLFIDALKENAAVISVSASNRVPGQSFNGYGIIPEGHSLDEHLLANVLETDANFASTYNIQLLKGRFFSPQLTTDTANSIIVNEAMERYLNWQNAVGKKLEIYEARKGTVVGVMKDFNFASLHETVQPLAIILNNNPLYISVKLKAGAVQSALTSIQNQWKQLDNEYPFDYFFMDEHLNRYYQSDTRLLSVLSIFAGLAIFIACIGLFGLSIYTAKQRTKEIGIRKVLGASVPQITLMLSKDFIKLVAIAIIIASPIGWWAANKWLQDFAYRIELESWIFILAGLSAITIALITVSFQAIKSATVNPVKSLRTE